MDNLTEDNFEYLHITGLLYEIAFLTLSYFKAGIWNQRISAQSKNQKIRQAVDYIKSHYTTNLSAADVSDYLGMSREYFSQQFKYYTGTTFLQYLNGIRITFAYRQLVSSDQAILDIAMNTGFRDLHVFSRLFKQVYHCPP